MEQFGLVMPDLPDDGYYGDERERTNKAYNLDLVSGSELTNDFWQMPQLLVTDYIPDRLIGFNYAKTSKDKSAGIHFYVDDYQFERVWNYPEKYVDILAEYACILTPDFSLYMDMPHKAMPSALQRPLLMSTAMEEALKRRVEVLCED
jgi:hypothetical protein